jgi:hypothetical protein
MTVGVPLLITANCAIISGIDRRLAISRMQSWGTPVCGGQ